MISAEYIFDENLREIAVDPKAMKAVCENLHHQVELEKNLDSKAKLLAKLGSYQRILNQLVEAESSHRQSLKLLTEINADKIRIVGAMIRLAHVHQWQKRFELSNSMFLDCLSMSETLTDLGEMKSYALQHHGKNLFDQKRYEEALKNFYSAMMIRVQLKKK